MKPKKMTRAEIGAVVKTAITEAVDFIESDIASDRLKAQRYYNGEVDIGHETGRSKVVATKCRDTVRAIKPALMRAFMASGSPVEFIPKQPDDVAGAEQQTAYADYKFNELGGYRLLLDAFHDALIKKVGILKLYFDETEDVEIDEYTGLTDEQFTFIASDDDIEVLEHSEEVRTADDGTQYLSHDMKVSYTRKGGDIKIVSVAPEDFFVDDSATCLEDAYIVGHRNEDMRVGDVVAMGYDFDEVFAHSGDTSDGIQQEAELERTGYQKDGDDGKGDPSMRPIMVTDAYMRMDVEGTGVPRMYRFVCIGQNYHMLDYSLCDDVPFAVFEVDPEPHSFFGNSIVEIILNDQDAATALLRGLLDNVALSNSPGAQVVEGRVKVEDLLNNEIGRVVRVKEMGALAYDAVPFTAGQTLPAMQYFDEVVEGKTGVSRASMGLDPDALQNTTATAVGAMVEAATGQVEFIARNLAEGGMKQVARLIMRLTAQHVDRETMMRLNGQFVPVDPRSWNTGLDMIANVGLGTGGEVEREMVLREVLTNQMTVFSTYGPSNGLVTMTQIRNTLADIMKLGGIHNADRYWQPMSPEIEGQLMQQAAQQQQGQQSDPAAVMAQAEVQKATINAQAKMQSDAAKMQQDGNLAIARLQMDAQRANQEDDRKRDEMIQKRILDAADLLGKYGITVDQDAIQRQQATN